MKMNLKEFYYKQFLLEKGERVGVGVAVAVMLLLVVCGLLLPSHGFFSGSPKEKADALEKVAKTVENDLKNRQPTESDLPPANAEDKKIPLDTDPVPATSYALAGLFEGHQKDKITRRMPEVLKPVESAVTATWANIDTYLPVFDPVDRQIVGFWFLKDAQKPGGGMANFPSMGGLSGGMMPRMPNMAGSGSGGMAGGGMRGRPGMGMAGMGGNMLPLMGGGPGKQPQMQVLEEGRKTFTPELVKVKDLEKASGVPMRQPLPLRLAIIAASFPFKDQLQEFQEKLHLSLDQVLQEQVKEVIRDPETGQWKTTDKMAKAFRFLGVYVQRRILDSAGKPLVDWTDVDLGKAYRQLMVLNWRRFEPDDSKYVPVSVGGLTMPRLLQFRKTPPDARQNLAAEAADDFENKYPEIETKLTRIQKTLDDLKAKDPAEIVKPPAAIDPTGFDPFNASGSAEADRKPAQGDNPGARGAGGAQQTIPEYCLIRLIDLDIAPGYTYQYQIKVRMANPNYGRTDVADPSWAQEKELVSKEWFPIPQTVTVPPELMYYALDQKEVEGKKYQGTVTGDIPLGERSRRTWLQIHRWLGASKVRSLGNKPMLIGEWAVADRVAVFRGEYTVAEKGVRLVLPIWSPDHNDFVLPVDPDGRKNKTPGFYVDFSHEGEQQTILVDFEGGHQTHESPAPANEDETKKPTPISDDAATEVLLMDPSGKLLGHTTAIDSQDRRRIEQREFVIKRVLKVQGQLAPKTEAGGGNPFGK